MMKRHILLPILFIFILKELGAQPGPLPVADDGFDIRAGIYNNVNPKTLLNKPGLIEFEQYHYNDAQSGAKHLVGFVEMHAVYDIDPEIYMDVVLDIAALPSYMPFIQEARIVSSDYKNHWIAAYKSGVNILGFSSIYTTLCEIFYEETDDGGKLYKSRLIDSPDEKMFEQYSSWYVSPIIIDGKRMCYIRYYNRMGMIDPSALVATISKSFSVPSAKDQLKATYKESLKRQNAAKK